MHFCGHHVVIFCQRTLIFWSALHRWTLSFSDNCFDGILSCIYFLQLLLLHLLCRLSWATFSDWCLLSTIDCNLALLSVDGFVLGGVVYPYELKVFIGPFLMASFCTFEFDDCSWALAVSL